MLIDYDMPLWRPPPKPTASSCRRRWAVASTGAASVRCTGPRHSSSVHWIRSRLKFRPWRGPIRVRGGSSWPTATPWPPRPSICGSFWRFCAPSFPVGTGVRLRPARQSAQEVGGGADTTAGKRADAVYYGIETGSADLLKRITKGATPEAMVVGPSKAKQAG